MADKKKKIENQTEATFTINGRAFTEAQLAAILSNRIGREPGMYDDTSSMDEMDKKYNVKKWTRVLPDKGGEIVWELKHNGFLACKPNLRFSKGGAGGKRSPIPGFGGDDDQWTAYDIYFLKGGYLADRKMLRESQRKHAASLKVTK